MKIELKSYNLKDGKIAIVQRCITDNPSFTLNQISKKLGVDEKVLFRLMKKYKFKYVDKRGNKKGDKLEKYKVGELVSYRGVIGEISRLCNREKDFIFFQKPDKSTEMFVNKKYLCKIKRRITTN